MMKSSLVCILEKHVPFVYSLGWALEGSGLSLSKLFVVVHGSLNIAQWGDATIAAFHFT